VSQLKFTEEAVVSTAKFQWPVAEVADSHDIPGLPEQDGGLKDKVVLIWGTGRESSYGFREGFPFLAVAPLASVEWMNNWRYLEGMDSGKPVWLPGQYAALSLRSVTKGGTNPKSLPIISVWGSSLFLM
jgi:hypothetical protein